MVNTTNAANRLHISGSETLIFDRLIMKEKITLRRYLVPEAGYVKTRAMYWLLITEP